MLDLPASVDPSLSVDRTDTHIAQPAVGDQPCPIIIQRRNAPDGCFFDLTIRDGAFGLPKGTVEIAATAGPLDISTHAVAPLRLPLGEAPLVAAAEGSLTASDDPAVPVEGPGLGVVAQAVGPSAPAAQLRVPAFPGCEGSGCAATGGRGGAVIEVTNLNDSGAGSLRACVEASGPRTCVFRVGGTIELQSGLWVKNPRLTVAGQTAPGGGILISGKSLVGNVVQISTHDVVWRYTRVRVGRNEDCSDDCSSAFALLGGADIYNIVIDHNSISWNEDEGIGIWRHTSRPMHDITISWNLLSEPLDIHPTSMLTGGERREFADTLTNVDIHHNLVISSSYRNPLAKNKSMRLINNIFYNYAFYATQLGGGIQADIIGNYYRAGPDTENVHEVQAFPSGNDESAFGTLSLYLAGNKGPNHDDPDTDNWADMTSVVSDENKPEIGSLSEQRYRRRMPMPARHVPITIHHVDDLEAILLPIVGASRRLDCGGNWVTARDAVDVRVIKEYETGTATGFRLEDESKVGGFPTINAGTPCVDTDHDGMPDMWERRVGLDPFDPADRNGDRNGDGYTNLEDFLTGRP